MSTYTRYTVVASTDRDGLIYTRTHTTSRSAAAQEIKDAQIRFYKLKIDFQAITQALCDQVQGTAVAEETVSFAYNSSHYNLLYSLLTFQQMHAIVRYAHERLTAINLQIRNLVAGFDEREIPQAERGNARQPEEHIDRAQHRGDEHWIRGADMASLIIEASISAHERRSMEASAANLTKELEEHDAVVQLRAEGRV